MNVLWLLASAVFFMHAASADRAIHTCYYYGSFSYVFKLRNLTRFILELMTELTLSENSALSMHIYFITVFVEIGNAECVQSKPYRVLTSVLPSDHETMEG